LRWTFERLYNIIIQIVTLVKEVQNAILRGAISIEQALIIGQLPKNRQLKFLNLLIATQKEAGTLYQRNMSHFLLWCPEV